MVSLSSIEIVSGSVQTTVAATTTTDQQNLQQEETSIVNAMGNGDTVEISAAARESYAALQAAGAGSAATEILGSGSPVASADNADPANGYVSSPASGSTAANGSGQAASGSGSAGTETDTSSGDVETLEEEITSLREEIAALAAQADSEGTNQVELAVKQAELAGLLAELAQAQVAA